MTMQTIPLTQLVPSPDNVRKTGSRDGIQSLSASIMAHGLLQNLQVRPAAEGRFEVVAGGRRLAALQLLVKQRQIAADYPVPCHALESANATEISLAENELRLPMHPADQFDAFKKLASDGKGPEEIAARFGTTAKTVMQRLKLAVVSPKLIALYRKDEMTLDCLMAFTVTDSHKQQEKLWKELPEWARNDANHIRDALTEKHIAADSAVAQFVGMDAYEAAGGTVLRDLFDDRHSGWLTDPVLANRLASEKLDAISAQVRGEGWKWVEIVPAPSWETLAAFGKVKPERTPPNDDQQREIAALTEEADALMAEHGDEPEDEAAHNRLCELQERINTLSDGAEFWPDTVKAETGAIVSIGHNGTAEMRRGLIRTEDKASARKAAKAKHADAADKSKASGLSAALIEDLTAHRTAALQARLAAQPKVALTAVAHSLALHVFYMAASGNSVLRIGATETCLERSAEKIDASKAAKELAAAASAMRKRLPKDPAKLWDWLAGQDQKTILGLLAVCAAHTVDAVQKKQDRRLLGHAGQLAEAVRLDMANYWQPTAEGYFSRVSKPQVMDAVAEATTRQAADNLARLKKTELAAQAQKLIAGSRWLPTILREA